MSDAMDVDEPAMEREESDEWGAEDDEWDEDGGDEAWGGDEDEEEEGGDRKHDAVDMARMNSGLDIPVSTRYQISNNCEEINLLGLFKAVPDLKSRSRIGAVLGIRIAALNSLTDEQLQVWGMDDPEFKFIILKLEFGTFYLNEVELPKCTVGLGKQLRMEEPLKSFRLSWTIEERINNSLLTPERWPPINDPHRGAKGEASQEPPPSGGKKGKKGKGKGKGKGGKPARPGPQELPPIDLTLIPKVANVCDLMESTEAEFALCLLALRKCNNDVNRALNMLFDEGSRRKLEKELPDRRHCDRELASVLSRVAIDYREDKAGLKLGEDSWEARYQGASDDDKVQHLASMFGIPFDAAKLSFQVHGYEESLQQLADEGMRSQMVAMATADEAKRREFGLQMIGQQEAAKKQGTPEPSGGGWMRGLFGKAKRLVRGGSHGDQKEEEEEESGPQIQMDHRTRAMVMMLRHNYLLRVLMFSMKVLFNGNKTCLICDEALAFAGLKPSICQNALCQFRHEQMGLGFSLRDEVLKRPVILDALIVMLWAGCNSKRFTDPLTYPYGVRGLDATNQTTDDSFVTEGGEQDIPHLQEVVGMIPSLEEMTPWAVEGAKALKAKLVEINPLVYPLLCWILTSNRCHLRQLADEEKLDGIKADMQFALCSTTPEKEAQFQGIKAKNKAFWAFHGSPIGNWHAIMRIGLKNYSKTKFQMHGAAHGSGIYMATHSQMSLGYCQRGSGQSVWPNTSLGTNIMCMALCEVINDPSSNVKKTSQIYVVEKEEYVVTRFFFVFDGRGGIANVEAAKLKVPEVVKAFE